MNITYKRDEQLKYKSQIIKGLVNYSETFISNALSETVNVYVLDDNKLVGACFAELEWNCLYIEKIFYLNQAILLTMMNKLYGLFKEKSECIFFQSYINDRIEDFKAVGFEVLCVLKDKPIGYDSNILVNKKMTRLPANYKYKIEVSKVKKEIYSKAVDDEVKAYNEEFKINDEKTKIEYIAFDQEKVIGGVFGYLIQDYLYVSIL